MSDMEPKWQCRIAFIVIVAIGVIHGWCITVLGTRVAELEKSRDAMIASKISGQMVIVGEKQPDLATPIATLARPQ